jgi:hypothetical protein
MKRATALGHVPVTRSVLSGRLRATSAAPGNTREIPTLSCNVISTKVTGMKKNHSIPHGE